MPLDVTTLRTRLQNALGQEFSVGDLLGEGGFAAVFRVRDKAGRQDVAVKVLDLGLTPSPALAERFVREARTVARLEHPHIVPISKVGGYKNEVLYIVMQCVDGPSLRQLLETRGRLSIGDAARVARQVADALAHAHARGVVHRDIKPDNILLDSTGRVLVTDFGIAKAAEAASGSNLTTEGMVVGTPQYMSPEQATGDSVDARSDVYSLGVVLYHMLAGGPPFDGDSAQAILMRQATATAPSIRRARKEVPAALANALACMLAKDPAERFQTAAEASRALLDAVPGAARDQVKLGRPGVATSGLTDVAARAKRTGLAALVVAALVWVAAFAWSAVGRAPRLVSTAPVSDSLNAALRRRGIVARSDTAVLVFSPAAEGAGVLLVVTERRLVAVAPHRLRGYPRESVSYLVRLGWRGAFPRLRLIVVTSDGRRDTVFSSMSWRDWRTLAPALDAITAARSRQT